MSTSQSFAHWCLRGQHPHALIQQELLCKDLLSIPVKQLATWTEAFCFSDTVDCLYLSGGHFKAEACGLNDGKKDAWLRVMISPTPSARLSGLGVMDTLATWTNWRQWAVSCNESLVFSGNIFKEINCLFKKNTKKFLYTFKCCSLTAGPPPIQ